MSAESDRRLTPTVTSLRKVTLPSADRKSAGQFGRQAQTVSLIDRLLTARRATGTGMESKLAELAELESKTRCLLETVLDEPGWERNLHCVPAAMCVR